MNYVSNERLGILPLLPVAAMIGTAVAGATALGTAARKGDSNFSKFLKEKTVFGTRARYMQSKQNEAADTITSLVNQAVDTRISSLVEADVPSVPAPAVEDDTKKKLLIAGGVAAAGLAGWLALS